MARMLPRLRRTGPVLAVLAANLLATLGNGRAAVAFTFTPVTGNWRVDDVYVDPYRQR